MAGKKLKGNIFTCCSCTTWFKDGLQIKNWFNLLVCNGRNNLRGWKRCECILLSAANPTSQIHAPGKWASVPSSPSHFLLFTTSLCTVQTPVWSTVIQRGCSMVIETSWSCTQISTKLEVLLILKDFAYLNFNNPRMRNFVCVCVFSCQDFCHLDLPNVRSWVGTVHGMNNFIGPINIRKDKVK
jgi:hypothetical protein